MTLVYAKRIEDRLHITSDLLVTTEPGEPNLIQPKVMILSADVVLGWAGEDPQSVIECALLKPLEYIDPLGDELRSRLADLDGDHDFIVCCRPSTIWVLNAGGRWQQSYNEAWIGSDDAAKAFRAAGLPMRPPVSPDPEVVAWLVEHGLDKAEAELQSSGNINLTMRVIKHLIENGWPIDDIIVNSLTPHERESLNSEIRASDPFVQSRPGVGGGFVQVEDFGETGFRVTPWTTKLPIENLGRPRGADLENRLLSGPTSVELFGDDEYPTTITIRFPADHAELVFVPANGYNVALPEDI